MFKDFLKKIWSSIIDHIFRWILSLISAASVVVFKDWIWKHLTTTYTADIPLWGWITIITIVAGVPLVVVLIIEWLRKSKAPPATSTEKLLTDPGDILNKIIWWLGKQKNYVIRQGRAELSLTWHFDIVDKELSLSPGSAKEHLPEIFEGDLCPFPVKILNKGPKTIMFCTRRII